jgi:cytochrome c peroxidase
MNFSPGRAASRPRRILSACLALAAGFGALSAAPPELSPGQEAARLYGAKLEAFREQAAAFRERTTAFQASIGPFTDPPLGQDVLALRDAYKEIEFLVEYLSPAAAARLNGAPFDRADFEDPTLPVLREPEGLQVLLAAADAVDGRKEPDARARAAIRELALNLEIASWEPSFAALQDRQVFEAMEAQVIRVMTKGIAGFDAPPERSLPESRRSLESLRPIVRLYLPALRRLPSPAGPALARRLPETLEKAVRSLRGDFETFDRLEYMRAAGNPLYAALIDAHEALGIARTLDLSYLGRPLFAPVNPRARNLFDPRFLNAHAYSRHPFERFDSAQAALGRRLFFDPVISSDGKRSCASCHDPRRAFADGLPKSPAFGGGMLPRNTPSISHAAFQRDQFWDLREKNLDEQALHVILGADEFRSNIPALIGALAARPGYPEAFRAAFPRDPSPLSKRSITQALAMYMRSLPTGRTAFDRYARGETQFLDPEVRRGFNLFMGKALCATCHFPPAFNGTVPPAYRETEGEVLGVPVKFPAKVPVLDPDLGRYEIHNVENFRHAFKTPSLRNVELTGPYMHNGGMAKLEDVLDFYNAGGGQGLGLDVPNQTLPADSLGLSRRDMDDIIAFLKALTDTAGFGAQAPR